jgi:CheY-like chemotaxis protein
MNTLAQFAHSESLRNAQPAPVPPKRSLHVLCIDDNELVLESMKDCIRHFGHRVGVASGGKCGVEMFCTAILNNEPYDLVITDLNMPDINGYAVAETIKAKSPHTPVILITGAGNITRDPGASVDTVVNKPMHLQDLNDLLLRLARPA